MKMQGRAQVDQGHCHVVTTVKRGLVQRGVPPVLSIRGGEVSTLGNEILTVLSESSIPILSQVARKLTILRVLTRLRVY